MARSTMPAATSAIEDQLFARLFDQLDRNQREPRGGGRRSNNRLRYRYRHVIQLFANVGDDTQPLRSLAVITRDISSGGIGFLHDSELEPGSRCVVELVNGDRHATARGHVRYCNPVNSAIYQIGMHFETPIDPLLFVRAPDHN